MIKPVPEDGVGIIEGTLMESDGGPGIKLAFNYTEDYPPVPETMVYLLKQNSDVLAAFYKTDQDGQFRFSELIDGSYSMLVDYMGIPMSNENQPILIDESNRNILVNALVSSGDIAIEIVTGQDEISRNKDIMIYPNPATDYIFLKFNNNMPADDYLLEINAMTGKTLHNEKIDVHDASQDYSIGIDELPGGIYVISLSGNKTIYKARFIKLD